MCLGFVIDPDGRTNLVYRGIRLVATPELRPWQHAEALLPKLLGKGDQASLARRLDDFIVTVGEAARQRIELDRLRVRVMKGDRVHLFDDEHISLGHFDEHQAATFLQKYDELRTMIDTHGEEHARDWFEAKVRTSLRTPEKEYFWLDPPRSVRGYCPRFEVKDLFRGVGEVRIKMRGDRKLDAAAANKLMEDLVPERDWSLTPLKYEWHHVDDLDPVTLECTMQLVLKTKHGPISHLGSVDFWKLLFGEVPYGRKTRKRSK